MWLFAQNILSIFILTLNKWETFRVVKWRFRDAINLNIWLPTFNWTWKFLFLWNFLLKILQVIIRMLLQRIHGHGIFMVFSEISSNNCILIRLVYPYSKWIWTNWNILGSQSSLLKTAPSSLGIIIKHWRCNWAFLNFKIQMHQNVAWNLNFWNAWSLFCDGQMLGADND